MCRVRESNPRHKDFQSFALPTELTRQVKLIIAYDKKKSTHFFYFLFICYFFYYKKINKLFLGKYTLTNMFISYIMHIILKMG